MEVWDLYTCDRVKTGETHVRGEALPKDRYHLVVHVWICNSKGEYLISRRAADRPSFPGMWECVGGSVLAGEDSLHGAMREAKEEVGAELAAGNGELVFTRTRGTIDSRAFQDILDVWRFRHDGEVDLTRATTAEVSEIQWMQPGEVLRLIAEGGMVPTLHYFGEIIHNKG